MTRVFEPCHIAQRLLTNVKRSFHTRFGQVSAAISRNLAYTGVPKICAKRVESVFNAL